MTLYQVRDLRTSIRFESTEIMVDPLYSVPFQTEFPFNSTDISTLTEDIKRDFASLLGLISLNGTVNVNAKNIKVEHVEAGPNGMATFYLSLNLETECVQSECSAVEDTVKVFTDTNQAVLKRDN